MTETSNTEDIIPECDSKLFSLVLNSERTRAREKAFLESLIITSRDVVSFTNTMQRHCKYSALILDEISTLFWQREFFEEFVASHFQYLTKTDNSTIFCRETFVVKRYKLKSDCSMLLHEAFIGIRVANELRRRGVVNFAWTYAIHNIKDQQCLLMERVDGYAIKNVREEKVLRSCLNQVFCALNVAWEMCRFTHYDLHHENIIIQQVSSEPFYLKYHFDGKDHYVWSPGVIAVIIDFGNAYAELDGFKYGAPNNYIGIQLNDNLNRFTDRGYLHSDLYRIVTPLVNIWRKRVRHLSASTQILSGIVYPYLSDRFANVAEFHSYMVKKYFFLPYTLGIISLDVVQFYRTITAAFGIEEFFDVRNELGDGKLFELGTIVLECVSKPSRSNALYDKLCKFAQMIRDTPLENKEIVKEITALYQNETDSVNKNTINDFYYSVTGTYL